MVAAALALAACGSDETPAGEDRLIVSGAASLKGAFEDYGASVGEAGARFSFGGSDELAAQIRRGVRPDVYAAANTKLPQALFREGLVERPVVFAGNRLVLAVPAGSRIASLADVGRPGVDLAAGAESVPIGSYTATVLARLPATRRRAVLANVRSREPDVRGIVGKLVQGAADAGFVYVTDVKATGGRVRAIELPPALQPRVAYGVAVVKGTSRRDAARAFVAGLLRGGGRAALERAGFERPPGS